MCLKCHNFLTITDIPPYPDDENYYYYCSKCDETSSLEELVIDGDFIQQQELKAKNK